MFSYISHKIYSWRVYENTNEENSHKVCFNKNNKKHNLRTSKLNKDLSQI